METLSQRLKKLRLKNGYNLKEVAHKLSIPATTYRDWEYGKSITGEPYLKIAELYNITLYELMLGSSSKPNEVIQDLDTTIALLISMKRKLEEISVTTTK